MKKFIMFLALLFGTLVVTQAQDTTLQQYTGKYKFPEGSVVPDITITIENGALVMASAAGTSALEKTSEADKFIIVQFQGTAIFKRDAEKKINAVSIDAGGYQLEGTKVESKMALADNYLLLRAWGKLTKK